MNKDEKPGQEFLFILKIFYDCEVLDETSIIKWYEDEEGWIELERKYSSVLSVKKEATKFYDWLMTADSEEDSDED